MDKQNSKYRWIVFAAVLFSYFWIVSLRTAPGLITDQLMQDFDITASVIGLMTSIQFLAYSGLQIPIGIWSDRLGPNRFLVAGTLLNGLGTLLYSQAANEYVLFLGRLLMGTGDAAIWVNLVLILSRWFKAKEFVGLISIAGVAGSLGFLMATVPFSAWIARLGWRSVFFTVGLLLCFSSLLLYIVLVKKPKQMFEEPADAVKIKPERPKTLILLRRMFSNRGAWAVFLCHFGVVGTYVGFSGSWAVPYGMQVYGMTRSDASQLLMIALIGSVIGSFLTSWISSRMGSIRRPYLAVHLMVFACWAAFPLFLGKPPFFMLILLFFLIGYGNGASTLTFAAVRQSFDTQVIGVISGFANTGGFLSAVLLPALFGKVLDHAQQAAGGSGYLYGFMIPVFFSLLGFIGGMLIQEKRREAALNE